MKSLKELFRIGPGPSSSHTIGPQRACLEMLKRSPDADHFRVTLYGSLALTGKGPCLEVSTMFLSEHQNQNIQISAYLSHFFYAKNYFNFFVFMI